MIIDALNDAMVTGRHDRDRLKSRPLWRRFPLRSSRRALRPTSANPSNCASTRPPCGWVQQRGPRPLRHHSLSVTGVAGGHLSPRKRRQPPRRSATSIGFSVCFSWERYTPSAPRFTDNPRIAATAPRQTARATPRIAPPRRPRPGLLFASRRHRPDPASAQTLWWPTVSGHTTVP